jgi:hypothetical protein
VIDKYKKLIINAVLAGFWVGAATLSSGKELSWAAALSAASVALRFAIGLVAKSVKALPAIPVDE